ncbi:MAG: hypothetical protein II897_10935, partial [Clostridia bacterium]|nr:hypothetical protein [Clostridia bacterium]
RKDGRVNGKKRIKETHGSEYGRIHLTIHGLKRNHFCAVPRQKCSKDFLQCILEKLFEFFCAFLLVRHNNLLF